MLTGALLMMAAAAAPADGASQRKALVACFRATVAKAQEEKKASSDFGPMVRAHCASEITDFRAAVIALDLRNGRPKKPAEADADVQVEDYVTSFAERLQQPS
jgi:hypothetical protein